MKVLVFGATGFIGHEIALSFVRAGYEVYGATRSAESAKKLEAEEISAIVCDPTDASSFEDHIAKVDVVIDAVGGPEIAKVGHVILDASIKQAKASRPQGPPLSYIYCSGTWVHGDSKTDIISDRSPLTAPLALTSWRVAVEQKAITSISSSFTANVIRPSILYGGSGSLIGATLFSGAKNGEIVWYGDESARMATIHKEDLAGAFLLCAEKAYAIPGVIFDITTPRTESVAFIMSELQAVSGAKKVTYKKPENDLQRALASSSLQRPQLAKSLLGWEARKSPLADGMKRYYGAWLAIQA